MKKKLVKDRVDDQIFIQICASAQSMAEAAAKLNLHFNSFKKRAIDLGCYHPNQAGKGLKKIAPKIPIVEIIKHGKYPYYQSYKLKNRLVAEGIKQNTCENCGISTWQGNPINLELHHIDGNRTNHLLENLMLLCPNCHSQTDTFRAKNRKI